jgi:hypothetical protein
MKICPRCQKTYSDDNLNFCLEDGSTLQQMAASAPPPAPSMSPPQANPSQPTGGQQNWSTPQQYGGQPAKKSKTWVWVLLILGLVVLVCGGGLVGFIFYAASQADHALSNYNFSTNSASTTSNRSTKPSSNSATTTTSSTSSNSSRSDVTKLDFKMFVHEFSVYGDTEIVDDELSVKVNSTIAYYVLAAPDEYTTEDADSRVTVRNTTGSISAHGYGLVFHSNPTPLQQGYAFLIDAKRKKYCVVHHEPHKETPVINWTASDAINPGTAENTLEVRDHDGTIDLYINDTKVNTISNTYGFSGGVVGLYVGQGVKVAFKDLEIRR